MMFKHIVPFIFMLLICQNSNAENKIKVPHKASEEILKPKSAKTLNCKEKSKEYSIISSDYCRVIKEYFDSLSKDD